MAPAGIRGTGCREADSPVFEVSRSAWSQGNGANQEGCCRGKERWAGKVGGFALRALAGRRTRRSADRVFHPRVPAACRRVGARAGAVVLEGLLGACLSFLWAAAWSCRTAARGRRRKKVTVVFVLFGRVEFPAHCLPVMQRGRQREVAGVHGGGV